MASSSPNNVFTSNNWTFNQLQGFQLDAVDSWDVEGEYVCSPSYRKAQKERFEIKVIGRCGVY